MPTGEKLSISFYETTYCWVIFSSHIAWFYCVYLFLDYSWQGFNLLHIIFAIVVFAIVWIPFQWIVLKLLKPQRVLENAGLTSLFVGGIVDLIVQNMVITAIIMSIIISLTAITYALKYTRLKRKQQRAIERQAYIKQRQSQQTPST